MTETTPNPSPTAAANGAPAAPPLPPRTITPAIARRAWGEPHVRFWWLGAGAVVLIFAWFVAAQFHDWDKGRKLIAEGTAVDAKVVEAGGMHLAGQKARKDDPVKLEYEYQGRTYDVSGTLEGNEQEIAPQSTVRIRIDPQDPAVWTYRTRAPSLGGQLVGGLFLLPVIAIIAAGAMLVRRRVLRTWGLSPAKLALVVDIGRSALAPSSKLLRCTLPDARDRKLHMVFVPAAVAINKGDLLYVLPPHKNKGPTLAAVAFGPLN